MGPMLIGGALLTGGTAVLFEGTPDYPKPDRLWSILERHRVTVLGISPTAVRALMPHGAEWVTRHDLSSLRLMASTGEPWNPEPYRWLFETAGKGRLPIINYTGGTEISGGILSCFPIAPIKPCSFAGPIPGMAADVYDDDGRPVRGAGGRARHHEGILSPNTPIAAPTYPTEMRKTAPAPDAMATEVDCGRPSPATLSSPTTSVTSETPNATGTYVPDRATRSTASPTIAVVPSTHRRSAPVTYMLAPETMFAPNETLTEPSLAADGPVRAEIVTVRRDSR